MPLHAAALWNNLEMVKELLSKDAHIDSEDTLGWTPLCYAIQRENEELSRFLLSKGARATGAYETADFFAAAKKGSVTRMELLTGQNAELVKARDCFSSTPLHTASSEGHEDAVQFLISMKADVNARDARGRTPLYLAAPTENIRMVEIFLAAGADACAGDDEGITPLTYARGDMATLLRTHRSRNVMSNQNEP